MLHKLSCQSQGKVIIIKYCGSNSYGVQRYYDANNVDQKYKGNEVYLQSPEVYPHKNLDTTDEDYVNYAFPLVL